MDEDYDEDFDSPPVKHNAKSAKAASII
jgi:hypothetical protein